VIVVEFICLVTQVPSSIPWAVPQIGAHPFNNARVRKSSTIEMQCSRQTKAYQSFG